MKTINVKEYGVLPGKDNDAVSGLLEALASAKDSSGTVISFPEGEYHFHSDRAFEDTYFISNNDSGVKLVAFPMDGFEGITIDGNGSSFIFHGVITPFILRNCTDVTLKNFSIDWEVPLHTQATVVCSDDGLATVEMHSDVGFVTPEGGMKLEYEKGGYYGVHNMVIYDPETRAPKYRAGDHFMGGHWWGYRWSFEKIDNNGVNISGPFDILPDQDDIIVFQRDSRLSYGIAVSDSKNITVENVDMYYAGAMGFVAQKTEDITLKGLRITRPEGSDRMFSVCADATHFVNCRGLITMENCLTELMCDDCTNIHGVYTTIEEITGKNSILVRQNHGQQVGFQIYSPGDTINFIARETILSFASSEVKEVKRLNSRLSELTLSSPVPDSVQKGAAVENMTWNPDAVIRNSVFKNNRPRGLLLTVPGLLLVENNTFRTAGSAIVVNCDTNGWFESGAVRDLTVRNNLFEDCGYGTERWGPAVINIKPQIKDFSIMEAPLHSRIKIQDNTFNSFDTPILRAISVADISFTGNTITATDTYKPFKEQKSVLNFEWCDGVTVQDNTREGFSGKAEISMKNCLTSDTAVKDIQNRE